MVAQPQSLISENQAVAIRRVTPDDAAVCGRIGFEASQRSPISTTFLPTFPPRSMLPMCSGGGSPGSGGRTRRSFALARWILLERRALLTRSDQGVVTMKKSVWRAMIEIGFIVFLFYSNLLMGEFERSGMGQKRGLAWAIGDVVTTANLEIAVIAALTAYILFEFLRKKF
jgi:hypothetical protein